MPWAPCSTCSSPAAIPLAPLCPLRRSCSRPSSRRIRSGPPTRQPLRRPDPRHDSRRPAPPAAGRPRHDRGQGLEEGPGGTIRLRDGLRLGCPPLPRARADRGPAGHARLSRGEVRAPQSNGGHAVLARRPRTGCGAWSARSPRRVGPPGRQRRRKLSGSGPTRKPAPPVSSATSRSASSPSPKPSSTSIRSSCPTPPPRASPSRRASFSNGPSASPNGSIPAGVKTAWKCFCRSGASISSQPDGRRETGALPCLRRGRFPARSIAAREGRLRACGRHRLRRRIGACGELDSERGS